LSQIDWHDWHADYADPQSRLAQRVAAVQRLISDALDTSRSGNLRAISICAGQGHDILGALATHPRAADVHARLVELDAQNVAVARARAAALGLDEVEVVQGDAAFTDVYAEYVPADLIVLCGVFGNLTAADIQRTIGLLPMLSAPRATVVWTRHVAPPDLTPSIRAWFSQGEFAELHFARVGQVFGVGAHRFQGTPAKVQAGVRMFEFVGYDRIRQDPALRQMPG
jgi:hypothetical protein